MQMYVYNWSFEYSISYLLTNFKVKYLLSLKKTKS